MRCIPETGQPGNSTQAQKETDPGALMTFSEDSSPSRTGGLALQHRAADNIPPVGQEDGRGQKCRCQRRQFTHG